MLVEVENDVSQNYSSKVTKIGSEFGECMGFKKWTQ